MNIKHKANSTTHSYNNTTALAATLIAVTGLPTVLVAKKITNWSEYNKTLISRGNVSML